jgi:hypothetical protein
MNVARLSWSSAAKGTILRFSSRIENSGELIDASDYDSVRTFVREMRSFDNLTFGITSK